jgi:LAO/AO transport system kinase
MTTLLQNFLNGDTRALARVISLVENRAAASRDILRQIYPRTGQAQTIGITGSPGVGKSSLVDSLAAAYRKQSRKTAIIAVDPSSPFTGGAILGDRIRMNALSTDRGVFIRSMATRGHLGGLAAATADVVNVLDAAGWNPVIVETVGVGQDEVEVVRVVDVSIVVLVPGMGDDVQALKAGIMEIGDIFVINKCDRPGVEKMEQSILTLLSLSSRADGWSPPVVKTVATDNQGIEELAQQIENCAAYFRGTQHNSSRKRDAAKQRLLALLQERLLEVALESAFPDGALETAVGEIADHKQSPHALVDEVVRRIKTSIGHS